MNVDLVFAPEVEQDLDEAYGWYQERRPGLGEEFMNCIDACIRGICRDPELYAMVYLDFRRALVRRFPYSVFDEYTDRVVTVYSVFHNSQDPAKWRKRLDYNDE